MVETTPVTGSAMTFEQTISSIKQLLGTAYPDMSFSADTDVVGYRVINCHASLYYFNISDVLDDIEKTFGIKCRVKATQNNYQILVPRQIKYATSETYSSKQIMQIIVGFSLVLSGLGLMYMIYSL